MTSRRLVLMACVGVFLAGCARFQPEPLSPALNATALDNRRLDDARLRRFVLASLPRQRQNAGAARWNLDTLTLAALYYHPDLAIADARLAGAQADILTARQRPNPSLNVAGNYLTMAVAGGFPPAALPLTIGPAVNFLIETFGKREDRTEQARHLADAARADVATAAWQVRGRVRTALLNLWAGQQRLALAQRQVTLRRQLVGLLEQRLGAGLATALEVTRERIALAQATIGAQDAARAKADALVQLATALGVPVRALDDGQLSMDVFDQPVMSDPGIADGPLRRQALTRRTDIRASLAQYEASQSALRLQVANQYPNVTLTPGYNYDLGNNRFILNPTFDLPIFNQNQGAISRALADRRLAAANFSALQSKVIGAVDAAAAAYRHATLGLRTADALLSDERVRQRQAQTSFKAGASDRPTLVAAELEEAVIRSSRFDARVLQLQALGAMEDALEQKLFDPEAARLVPQADPLTVTEPPA